MKKEDVAYYSCLDVNQNISWTQATDWDFSKLQVAYEFTECEIDKLSQACEDTRKHIGSKTFVEYAYSK